MKKALSVIINTICIIMIVVAILLLGTVVLNKGAEQPSILGFRLFRVLTASMEPKIPVNAIVLVKETAPEDIQVGDIITFYSADPTLDGATNTHRVMAINSEKGYPVFTTKGDNSVANDKYLVEGKDLIGKVVFISGIVGIVMSLVSNPLLFAAVIIIPLAIIFIVNLKDLVKSVKKLETMEIIEAVEQSGEDTTPIAFGDDEPEAESPPADADPVAEAPAADEGLDATPIKWDD